MLKFTNFYAFENRQLRILELWTNVMRGSEIK